MAAGAAFDKGFCRRYTGYAVNVQAARDVDRLGAPNTDLPLEFRR